MCHEMDLEKPRTGIPNFFLSVVLTIQVEVKGKITP